MSRFVWFEHRSTDVPGAQRFYGELFGWRTQSVPGGAYARIAQGDTLIGGYREPVPGGPSRAMWLSYLAVPDVRAAASSVTSLGGAVRSIAAPVGDLGTMAIASDPAGAVFALCEPAPPGDGPADADFRFCWNELYTSDMPAAVAFYRGVSGLGEAPMSLGGQPYTMLVDGAVPVAGIAPPPPFDALHLWQPVVAVPDADASLASATRLGAAILAPIEDVPSIGRFFVIADPLGAVLGILQRPNVAGGSP